MKDDIVYLLAYLSTEFFNYTLAYVVIFYSSLRREKKVWILIGCILFIFHFSVLQFTGVEDTSAISVFSMLVIPTFLLGSRKMKNFLLYPFVVFGTSVIGVSVSFLFATIFKMPEHMIVEGNWYTILCQGIQSIALIIVAGYRKFRKKDSYQVNLDWKQYVLLYIVVSCLFFMIAPIQGLTEKYGSDYYINLSGLFVSIACIVLVIVTIWQGIIVNREIQLKERNKKNEEYLKMQKEYYESLLEQDEKMRRFRHDLKAHITVIEAQCQNGDYKDLEDYLKCIVEESAVLSVERYTGNKGVDAVLRQLLLQAEKQRVTVEMKGSLPEKIRVNEYDLCTILSNFIKNAIEACEKINEISRRNIKILIEAYNDEIFISVKNRVVGSIPIKENQLITTKENHKNHGLGSGNVRNVVNKYNGILEYQFDKGWFTAEVII